MINMTGKEVRVMKGGEVVKIYPSISKLEIEHTTTWTDSVDGVSIATCRYFDIAGLPEEGVEKIIVNDIAMSYGVGRNDLLTPHQLIKETTDQIICRSFIRKKLYCWEGK